MTTELFASCVAGLFVSIAYRREPWYIRCLLAGTAGILVGIVAQTL